MTRVACNLVGTLINKKHDPVPTAEECFPGVAQQVLHHSLTNVNMHIYTCVYMYVCMCVCVCVFPAATQRPSKHDCITILKYMCVYYMSHGQHSSCTTSLELISRSHSPSGLIDQHQGTALLDTSVTVPRKANSFEHTGLGACTTVKTVGSSPTPAARTMAGNNFSKV